MNTLEIVQLVCSSTRLMPAHYSSNGDRTQSFCIEFDMHGDDEYNMASFSFYEGSKAVSQCKTHPNPTEEEAAMVVKMGEDITVGAYIHEIKKGSFPLSQLVESLIYANLELIPVRKEILDDKAIKEYLASCSSYGISKASSRLQG